MSITVGQAAPDFTLLNQEKKEVQLSDFAGKKNVVLVWYPLDWSPTCTNEHACFVNEMKAFETLDAEVLGVSVDSVWSHKAYAEKMGIKYSLLADFHPRGAMSEKRSEEHTSELQSPCNLVCRLLLEKKKEKHIVFQFDGVTPQ